MKIGEARTIYREQITAYRDQQQALQKQRQELQKKIDSTPDGKTIYAKEAATLELTYDAVSQKQQEYQDYMAKLLEQKSGYMDMMAAKNEGEAMKEYAEDMAKIMQVARRIMKGGIVPLSDERKLMEFDNDLYQMAKSIGAMVQFGTKRRKKNRLMRRNMQMNSRQFPVVLRSFLWKRQWSRQKVQYKNNILAKINIIPSLTVD